MLCLITPIGHLIQEEEHSCQSKKKAAIQDRPCRTKDRSSQEGGDDGNHPTTIHPHNNEEEEALDLRTNPFQEGGDDGRGPSTSPHASPPKGRFGPTTRVMANKTGMLLLMAEKRYYTCSNAINSSVE